MTVKSVVAAAAIAVGMSVVALGSTAAPASADVVRVYVGPGYHHHAVRHCVWQWNRHLHRRVQRCWWSH